MKELGPEVARQAESSQPTQPNPNPIHRAGRPVETEQTSRSSAQEIDTRFSLGCESTNERTGRLVYSCVPVSVERSDKDKDTDENEDADRVRTVRPVGGHQSSDLQQSNAYNPFSEKSKKMIRDMGNAELFELCQTIPKVQCSECLLYWNQGIVYRTCGPLERKKSS